MKIDWPGMNLNLIYHLTYSWQEIRRVELMCNGLNKSEDTLFRKIESEKSHTYVENNYRELKVKRIY